MFDNIISILYNNIVLWYNNKENEKRKKTMRNKLTAREKINAKSGMSIKNLDFENGKASFDCIAVTISAAEVDGKIVDNATFITADGTAVNTISSTIIESVNDIIDLIDDGEITADEVLTITVTEKTSNAGRKFYMIEI